MAIVTEQILKINTQQPVKSIKDLRDNIKGYKGELSQLERGTNEYNKVLDKLAQSQNKLNQINRDARNSTLTLTQQISAASSVASGLVAGFNALNSVSALLGVENEALAETFVKLQAGMALVQSITALSRGYASLVKILPVANKAQQAFNKTVLANPYVAAAAALLAFVAAIYSLNKAIYDNRGSVKELNSSYDALSKQRTKANNELDRELGLLRAVGASEQEQLDKRRKANNEDIARLEKYLEGRRNRLENASKRERKIILGQIDDANDLLSKAYSEQQSINNRNDELSASQEKKAQDDAIAAQKRYLEEQRKIIEDNEKAVNAALKTIYDDREAIRLQGLNSTQINAEIEAQELVIQSLIETIESETTSLNDQAEAARQLSEQQTILNNLKSAGEIINNAQNELNERITLAQDAYNTRIQEGNELLREYNAELEFNNLSLLEQYSQLILQDELLTESHNNRLIELAEELEAEETTEERRAELLEERIELINELDGAEVRLSQNRSKRTKQAIKEDQEESSNAKKLQIQQIKATAQFFSTSSNLLSENTAAQKALQVASATMSTYAGAAQVLANPTELNPYVKWAQFATTIATGLVAVKNILSTNIPGGVSDTSGSVNTTIPALPQLEGDIRQTETFINGNQFTQLNQDRTVLVIDDLNEVSNDRRVKVSESTF